MLKNTAAQLRIASLYSLGHIEEAIYNLNSYEHFIRHNVKKAPKRENKFPGISYVRDFIKFRTGAKPIDEYTLNKIIDDSKNSDFHFWFESEAEKLKKAGLKPV